MSILDDIQSQQCMPAHQALAGDTVVHVRVDKTEQTFVAIVDEKSAGMLQDDREGRHVDRQAEIVVPLTDVDGVETSLDDQGSFVIKGLSWQVGSINRIAGSWIVHVKRRNNKTMRTVHANR